MKKILAFAALMVVAYLAFRLVPVSEPPPILGRLPEFSFTDIQGRKVDNTSLHDGSWAINFFFSSCPKICPAINSKLKALSLENPELNLLSISVDPERDTAEALANYAAKLELPLERWHFVTLPKAESAKFAEQIMLYLGDTTEEHNTRVVFTDHMGQIRGSFRGNDAEFEAEARALISGIRNEHR